MTDQEVPTWDPDNLPQSWDEALERYAKVGYRKSGKHILFEDIITGDMMKYHINCPFNIVCVKWNDFFYYYVMGKYMTYIGSTYIEYISHNQISNIGAILELYRRHDPDFVYNIIDNLTTDHQLVKSARK